MDSLVDYLSGQSDVLSFGGLTDYSGGVGSSLSLGDVPTSGAVQSSWSTGSLMSSIGGVVDKLADWDTKRRLTNIQNQNVVLASRQNPNNTDYTTRAVSQAGSMRLGDLVPYLVVGFIAWRVMK